MAKLSIKNMKGVTALGAPVEKTIKWEAEVTEANIQFLKDATGNQDLAVGDQTEVEGQVFVKKLSFRNQEEIIKSFEWDIDAKEAENSKIKGVNGIRLQAARILGSICDDAKGTPFFASIDDVLDCDISFCGALYAAADEVNNFMGKSRTKTSIETSSSANSHSTESAETQSKKSSKTSAKPK
ncbi:MAG: phage tail assembly chaperone family protein, TAC [Acinetobacter junii]|nr:phage tail assembly chaperone family protein, TAC [Acinetobacter junii]